MTCGAQNFLEELLGLFSSLAQNLKVIIAPQTFTIPTPLPASEPAHLANHKDVGQPGGEAVARAVLDVNHIKGARVTLPVGDHADTAQVSTSGHHAHVT